MAVLLVVAALCERNRTILVSLRPEGKALAGFWELPGGKKEPLESPEEALQRELQEELGVASHGFSIEAVLHHCYEASTGGPREVLLLVYRCEIVGEPVAREVAEVRWADAASLRELPFLEADRDFVRQLADKLEKY
jgi:8-oxo-dGTP diphosphatase